MKKGTTPKKTKRELEHPLSYTQAFSNLVTAQEQQIKGIETCEKNVRQNRNQQPSNYPFIDDEDDLQVSVQELKKVNAEKMSVLVGQLLAKNVHHTNIQKISVKNAFEVPLIHLNSTCAFVQASSDNSWKMLSSTLESNNKIYGYRVDATHNYTYRVLESITRQEKKDPEDQQKISDRRERPDRNSLNSQFICAEIQECYAKYLQKNYRNINILHLDTFFNVNPILEKTKRIFDQNGLRALLLNSLDISLDLSLKITLHQTIKEEIYLINEQQAICSELELHGNLEGYNIFKKIYNICIVNDLIEREEPEYQVKRETGEIQLLWQELQIETIGKNKRKLAIKVQNIATETLEERPFVEFFQSSILIVINPPPPIDFTANYQNEIQAQSEPNPTKNDDLEANQFEIKQSMQPQNQEVIRIANQAFLKQVPRNNQPAFTQGQQNGNQNQASASQPQTLRVPLLSLSSQECTSRSCNIVETSQTNSHITQMSDCLPSRKSSYTNDIILREITDFEAEPREKYDLVSKWKLEKSPKKRQERKKSNLILEEINFFDKNDGVTLKRRHLFMSLDKVKRKQFKKLLKNLKILPYAQTNCIIDMNKCKTNYQIKTLLNEFYEGEKMDCPQEKANPNESLNMGSNNSSKLIIDLENSNNSRSEIMKNFKNTSIRQTKDCIKEMILSNDANELAFDSIYANFVELQGNISPALCFLTVLHLANEYNYHLVQREGEYNFAILKLQLIL